MVKRAARLLVSLGLILSLSTNVWTVNAPGYTVNPSTPEITSESKQETRPSKPKTREVVANVSAYTASVEECGKDDGITASGVPVQEGHIAADDLPFGTKVIIEGRTYTVTDRFGGGYRNRIDIFMPSRASAERFGRKHITVYIVEESGEN